MILKMKKLDLLPESECIVGRAVPINVSGVHSVSGNSYLPPFPTGMSSILFGMGCFWGVERLFWTQPGVYVTAAGYAGGETENPTYEEVCSGQTNHTEVVLVVFDQSVVSLEKMLQVFWEGHDPTQGMRQGNDRGTQYRSAIFVNDKQMLEPVERSRDAYQTKLLDNGFGEISTEVAHGRAFFYAEDYHQQYLHKVPNGYCGLSGTGVTLKD